jgi:hypothetical protein
MCAAYLRLSRDYLKGKRLWKELLPIKAGVIQPHFKDVIKKEAQLH